MSSPEARRRSAGRGSVTSSCCRSARASLQASISFGDGELAELVAADALAEEEHASPSLPASPTRAVSMFDRGGRQPWSRDPRCQLCFLGRHHNSSLHGLPTCAHGGERGASSPSRAAVFFGSSAEKAKHGTWQILQTELGCGLRTMGQSEGEKTASERADEVREQLDRSAALSRHLLFDARGDPVQARWAGLQTPGRVWMNTGTDTATAGDSQPLWLRHTSQVANDHMCYGTPPSMSVRRSSAMAAAVQASKQSRGAAATTPFHSMRLPSSDLRSRTSRPASLPSSQVGTPRGVPSTSRTGLAARPP